MIDIEIGRVTSGGRKYRDVSVTHGRTEIDVGFLSKQEAFELADKLQDAIDELTEGW